MVATKTVPTVDELVLTQATVDSVTPDKNPSLRGSEFSVACAASGNPGSPENGGTDGGVSPVSPAQLTQTGNDLSSLMRVGFLLLLAGAAFSLVRRSRNETVKA